MGELGRPLLPSGVTKIEQGQRRVDADDLVALAIALRVNPSRLLLSDDGSDQEMALTPTVSVPAFLAWQWADGYAPLPTRSEEEGFNTPAELEDFQFHTRPAEIRREQQHPLTQAVGHLLRSVRRVLYQASKTPDPERGRPDLGLETTLAAARRNLQRVGWELDAVEEEAVSLGER